ATPRGPSSPTSISPRVISARSCRSCVRSVSGARIPRSTWSGRSSITPIRIRRPRRTRCPRGMGSRPSRADLLPSPPTITRSSSGSSPCTTLCTPSASGRSRSRHVPLEPRGYTDPPPHTGTGGFDHAAIHQGTRRLYIAHTANHAVDVIDCERQVFVQSIDGLRAVAGVLISEESGWAFTSNRGENTIGIFRPGAEDALVKVPVGVRPNGLAFDAGRGILLAANVGDPAVTGSFTLSVADVVALSMRGAIPVPGRTRWAIYDRRLDRFFVNISDPPIILAGAGPPPSPGAVVVRKSPLRPSRS